MSDIRCIWLEEDGFHHCGSYAFSLHGRGIEQGSLCDVHYWQHEADALRAELTRLREEHAENEAAALRAIDQRDAAEDALSDAFRLVTGREPEWSNLFGYADAMEEITASLDQKESALAAARKALEKIAQAPGDNIGVWCRHTATAALERINGEGHE